jgi:predicted anti-sigma-YlaC factor YlaD
MKNQKKCEFELTVVKFSRSGLSNEEIKAHVRDCTSCRETLKIASWLQMSAKSAAPQAKNLPAAGFLWWKFRIQEKRRAAERVVQPILIAQIASAFAASATLVWLLFSKSLRFDFLDSAFSRAFASMEIVAVPFLAGIICFAFFCAALVFILRRYLSGK